MATPVVTPELLAPAIEELLRTEDWDTVTVKLIMRKLEGLLAGGADLPAGWIAPHKKAIKQIVDQKMAAIMEEQQGKAAEAEPAPDAAAAEATPASEAKPAPAPPPKAADKPSAKPAPAKPARAEPAGRKRRASEAAAEPKAAPAPAPAPEPEADADADADAGADAAVAGTAAQAEKEGAPAVGTSEAEAEADPADADEARFIGRPVDRRDGKVFYAGWTRLGVTYRVGTDVYLDPPDADALPYVARLVEVYAYGFAADEVYFTARWYYRDYDVKQYGLRDKARAESLRALEGELYLSLHEDENHADTILRAAKVGILQGRAPAPQLEQHEYFCRAAYDDQGLYDVTDVDLISRKKLRAIVVQELDRQPEIAAIRERAHDAKRQRSMDDGRNDKDDEARKRKATFDELCAIALTRKTIEIWLDADPRDLQRVLLHSIVRTCQRLNSGAMHFTVGIVLEVRNCPPYKVGKKVTTVALWVRTGQGRKLVRLDALSNEAFTAKEYADFTVPVNSYGARDKFEKLRALTQRNVSIFTQEEQRQMEEEEAKLQERLERARAEESERQDDAQRRARERDEVRERQNQKKVEAGDQWWKVHAADGDSSERERAKWAARLKRFEAIAASSAEEGERTNAARLATSARKKLAELESSA